MFDHIFPSLTSLHQAYFTAASALHNQEMKDLFVTYSTRVKKATDEEMEMSEYGRELLSNETWGVYEHLT